MANLIEINGWVVSPTPSDYKGFDEPVVNGGRNANAYFVGDLIARKTKLELSWKMLTASQLATLRSYTNNFFVTITWINTETNTPSTINCYTSPVSWSTFKYSDGAIQHYNDVRVSFVER